MANQVYICKNNINKTLGNKSTEYWSNIKKWLKHIYTEEELTTKNRLLFDKAEDIYLHINFMVALKTKLLLPQVTNTAPSRHKTSKRRSKKHPKKKPLFEPAQIQDYAPLKQNQTNHFLYANGSVHVQTYSAQELFLPDKAMVLGRLLVAMGDEIEDATEGAAEMIVQASHIFLKNVLSGILSKYKAYKTINNNVKYDVGIDIPDPLFRIPPEVAVTFPNPDKLDQLKNYAISSSKPKKEDRKQITVDQVYDAIRLHRNLIANHSVFSLSVERISLELDNEDSDNK
ncbi:transcriptional adapter 1-like [Ctenocephalides felis]|uniref:transcriptional adapter 1-like n=1 Tax=Ctenocephalides felis TaxID=7515 RepID=UPI000E6E5359|nr:transcriptional adapter 1-like [Ctenocephalides felis]